MDNIQWCPLAAFAPGVQWGTSIAHSHLKRTDRYSYIPVDTGSHTAGCVKVQRVRVSSQAVSACVDQSVDCSSLPIRWVVAVVKESENFKKSPRDM